MKGQKSTHLFIQNLRSERVKIVQQQTKPEKVESRQRKCNTKGENMKNNNIY